MTATPNDQFLRLIRTLGSPPHLEHGPAFDAVFGPFDFEGEAFYRYYDASTCIWQIGKAIPAAERGLWPLPAVPSNDDRLEDVAAANALNFLPAPRMPAQPELDSFRGPFWHEGRRFFWVLPSVSEGWRLALCIDDDGSEDAHLVRFFDRTQNDAGQALQAA